MEIFCSTWNISSIFDYPNNVELSSMFHVEHLKTGIHARSSTRGTLAKIGSLVVETQQENDADDDRRKKNLADVVIEDLLIRAGGVAASGFFLALRLRRNNRIDRNCSVVFYVHVLTPLVATQNFPCGCRNCLLGSSSVSGGKVFITKVPPSLQLFFAGICKISFKTGILRPTRTVVLEAVIPWLVGGKAPQTVS